MSDIILGVNSDAQVRTLSGESGGHGSPTSTLISDILDELFASTPSARITAIDRVCVFSSASGHELCTSVASGDWSLDTNAFRITVQKSMTATATATYDRARAYSGTKLYFETPFSPAGTTVTVNPGDTVVLTFSITVSMTHSLSTSGISVQSFDDRQFRLALLSFLRGVRPYSNINHLTLVRARYFMYDPASDSWIELMNVPLTRDRANRRAYHDPAFFPTSARLHYILLEASGTGPYQTVVQYNVQPIDVTPNDSMRYEITISVS